MVLTAPPRSGTALANTATPDAGPIGGEPDQLGGVGYADALGGDVYDDAYARLSSTPHVMLLGTGALDPGSGIGAGGGGGAGDGGGFAKVTQAGASGQLDADAIQRVILHARSRFFACYKEQLEVDASLSGRLTTRFTITADGHTADVSATGISAAVEACVASVLQSLVFPRPTGGDAVVQFPFIFDSAQ